MSSNFKLSTLCLEVQFTFWLRKCLKKLGSSSYWALCLFLKVQVSRNHSFYDSTKLIVKSW